MSDKTFYDPKITPEFIYECAKIGMVSLSSHQISICGKSSMNLSKLKIPDIYLIEWVGNVEGFVSITLRLK